VAWLIRVNRIHGRDEKLANARTFATAFRGGSWNAPASVSQVSRWETACVRAGCTVLRRYEELLGVPPHQLLAAADWAYRETGNCTGRPVLDRGVDPTDPRILDQTEELLDRALSTELMSGADWDRLSSHLLVLPAVLLHPSQAWEHLAQRLLAELLIADGMAWMMRAEAMARLIAHPRTRGPIIDACASLVADPTNQVVIEPLTILDQTADRDANRHVVAQLSAPTSERVLRGALLACIEKVGRRHFTPDELRRVLCLATDLASAAAHDTEVRNLATHLCRLASPHTRGSSRDRLRRPIDPTTEAILSFGQTAPPASVDQITRRLLASVVSGLPRHPRSTTDPMLARLLGEVLFSPNQNERLMAAGLVAATPYRDHVASALATELSAALSAKRTPLIMAILAALPFVGRRSDRDAVERLVLASGLPPQVNEGAAWALGHIPGRSDGRFWTAAIEAHVKGPPPDKRRETAQGLVYAMGMGREHRLLRTLRADLTQPASVRNAATWWLKIPRTIQSSASI
jgi:hypothetical protein